MSRTMPKQKPHRSEQTVVTPMEFIAAVKRKLGISQFSIDLAALEDNTHAFHFFCPNNDALQQKWDIENATCLHAMQAGLSSDTGVLLPSSGKAQWTNLVVSPMLQEVRQRAASTTTARDSREGSGREAATQILAEGTRVETPSLLHRQPYTTNKQRGHSLYMVGNSMACVSPSMGTSMRVLRESKAANPRSLCSTEFKALSGHGSVEHGSGVQVVQLSQGRAASERLVRREAVCRYCGETTGGGWFFLNPPYDDIRPWVEKANESWRKVVMLVPASVGSNWWRDYVHEKARVLFLNGRITFEGHKAGYPKDLALLVYGLKPGYDIWDWQ